MQRLHERNLAAAQAILDEAVFAAAKTEGEALTIEQAVNLALASKSDILGWW